MAKETIITVRVSPVLKDALEFIARSESRTLSNFVGVVLQKYVIEHMADAERGFHMSARAGEKIAAFGAARAAERVKDEQIRADAEQTGELLRTTIEAVRRRDLYDVPVDADATPIKQSDVKPEKKGKRHHD
jgi:hypothetical protein